MLRVVIIDDEKPSLQLLGQVLGAQGDVTVVGAFTKPSELLRDVSALQPDAAFLDIEMPGMNGLELAERLLGLPCDISIVFVTAYKQYAFEAFGVSAVDYVLKPVQPEAIERTVERLQKRRKRTEAAHASALAQPMVICFGGLETAGSGTAAPLRFPTAKTEELFAFLLMHRGKNAAKWVLCDSLWPGFAPDKAEQNLHTTAFRLKRALKESGIEAELKSQRGYYRLDLKAPCDYAEFSFLMKQANLGELAPERLKRSISLYRGPLFGTRDYAWCVSERERLQRHFAAMSKKLAHHCIALQDLPAAADALLHALEKVPYDEEGHELLLRAFLRMGDRASFLMHYDKLDRMLREELDVEPNEAIRAIFDEVRQ